MRRSLSVWSGRSDTPCGDSRPGRDGAALEATQCAEGGVRASCRGRGSRNPPLAEVLGLAGRSEVAEGRWTFKRVGFWRTRGTLRVAGDEDDIGTFEARWTGNGTLTLASGESYGWESTNLWGTRYGWSDSRGTELVRFGATASLLREEAAVELSPRASALSDLPLLVLYGWYLLVMHNRDAAGATAATAGGASSS